MTKSLPKKENVPHFVNRNFNLPGIQYIHAAKTEEST